MQQKHPVNLRLVRRVPSRFSWVDHRLVHDRYFERLSHSASALYLFLVTVADSRGLSYWADPTLQKRLRMDAITLQSSRKELLALELILWRKPIYQILPLSGGSAPEAEVGRNRRNGPVALSQFLQSFTGDAP